MRRLTVALLSTAVAAAIGASQSLVHQFELETWGMPGSPRFVVTLSGEGELSVIRESPPFNDSGPTVRRATRRLSKKDADRLATLAERAVDFSNGCMTVADGQSALLTVKTSTGSTKRLCEMAQHWPLGRQTKLFIDQLNSYLPKELHVF